MSKKLNNLILEARLTHFEGWCLMVEQRTPGDLHRDLARGLDEVRRGESISAEVLS